MRLLLARVTFPVSQRSPVCIAPHGLCQTSIAIVCRRRLYTYTEFACGDPRIESTLKFDIIQGKAPRMKQNFKAPQSCVVPLEETDS